MTRKVNIFVLALIFLKLCSLCMHNTLETEALSLYLTRYFTSSLLQQVHPRENDQKLSHRSLPCFRRLPGRRIRARRRKSGAVFRICTIQTGQLSAPSAPASCFWGLEASEGALA